MIRRLPTALTLFACLLLAAATGAAANSYTRTYGKIAGVHYLHPESVKLHKASGPRPSITKVIPMHVEVGAKLILIGKNFRTKAGKNKVFFMKPGGGVIVAKAQTATSTRLEVTIPADVIGLLDLNGKSRVPTKIQIRVLTGRFGSPTKLSGSPTILPNGKSGGGGGNGVPACMQPTNADSDGDGLSNKLEIQVLHTDPCNPDTDGDGVPDGYEYQSALDLENTTLQGRDSSNALPCACAKPYPNPLDPTDANVDHDGDGLTMKLEYQLNKYVGGPKVGLLQYSDGKQRSQDVPAPADAVLNYMDFTKYPSLDNGFLNDGERDADNDGLTNWDECCGRMTQAWWDKKFDGSQAGYPNKETHYTVVCGDTGTDACPVNYPGVDPMNPDTNGNGIPDGLDDQDHDGLTNRFEVSRPWDWQATYVSVGPGSPHSGPVAYNYASHGTGGALPDGVGPNPWARVQPFNPCKPVYSKTCHTVIPGGAYKADEDWAGPDPETLGPPPAAPWLFDTTHDVAQANGESYPMSLGTP